MFRRTTDKLAFHKQKVMEAFNKKVRKLHALSFDIQAAFVAVWRQKTPSTLGIIFFITSGCFSVVFDEKKQIKK